jgi:hypothetical protein
MTNYKEYLEDLLKIKIHSYKVEDDERGITINIQPLSSVEKININLTLNQNYA